MSLLRDFRYALKTLSQNPGYTFMCIAVLALGIGSNAAIFSVVSSVVLQALPYPDSARLVFVWERFPNMPPPIGERMEVALVNYVEWKRQNKVFEEMGAFRGMDLEETGMDHPRRIKVGFASAGLLPMLGVQPRLGRLFTPEEEHKGSDSVVVLTDSYFDKRFRRDPAALGKSLALGKSSYTIIGILPPKFHLPSTYEGSDQLNAEVWVPLSRLWNTAEDETRRMLKVAARLKPGVSLAQARTEMEGLAGRLAEANPDVNKGFHASVFPFVTEDTEPKVHRALYVLMAAVGFLLLIACANLANLTLARATLRSREIAVRLALGATRTRIVAQLVTESLVVSLAGAGAGLLLAQWCVQLMLKLKPEGIQRPELVAVDLSVFAFAAIASILTTILFGLAPSVLASRADLNVTLKNGGGWGASSSGLRSRQALIALEVALALVLVAGAGLMIRSFQELVATGIGFNTDTLTLADVELPAGKYPDGPSQSRFFRSLMDRVRPIPGVQAVTVLDNLPLHRVSFSNFYIEGRPDPPISALPMADTANVSPSYFGAIRLPLETGRLFSAEDLTFSETGGNTVAIVNRAFVRRFFPNENPLGRRLLSPDRKQASEIVGVIADYRAMGVENGTRPTIFRPSLQLPQATLLVRAGIPSESLSGALRNAIWSVDSTLPAPEVLPMQHYVDGWLSQRKFNTLLLGIFAGLALFLGLMGIYGVLANLVASRIREIGIRMAIGATPSEIGRLVLRQGMIPVLLGTFAGLAGSLVLGRFLESLLYQVHPRDPLTLASAAAVILLVSPLAIYIPLYRATRVDCTVALREE